MIENFASQTQRTSMLSARLEQRLRLLSGLVMAVFVSMHLVNHALGLISIEVMESARNLHALLWQNLAGKTILFSALAVHFMLALWAMYRRSTFSMSHWEAAQMAFGFAIPLLLAGHIAGVELAQNIIGFDISYPYVMGAIWSDEWLRVKQVALLFIAWVHTAIGLHFWLRLKAWYRRVLPLFHLLAVVLPILSVLGFVRAGLDMQKSLSYPEVYAEIFSGPLSASMEQLELMSLVSRLALWSIIFLILFTLLARQVRLMLAHRHPRYTIHHPTAGNLRGLVGQSVLEVLRSARIPHASICGGRARCTACRINIDHGLGRLNPPSNLEASALKRINADNTVRLACQIRPETDIWITPLLPPPKLGLVAYQDEGVISGNEQEVVAMFVDLRGFSSFAETRLPYDVVLILNQFFGHMSAALAAARGHYVQFTGDGLFALFGLQGDIQAACRDALSSAVEMQNRLEEMNQHVRNELGDPLRIGIGIHCGEAIVGPMGPPDSRVVSAIGDSVNIASRLEAATKQFDCIAVISSDTIERAGLELHNVSQENIAIRGRQQMLAVYPIYDVDALKGYSEKSAR